MFSTWRECNDPFSAVSIWERIFNWPGWLPNSIWKSRGSCLLYIGYYRMSAATELEDSCFKIYAPTVGLRLAAFIFNHDVAESYAWTTNTSQVFVAVYCSSAREVEDKCLPSNLVASFPASLSLRMSRCHQRSLQWLDKKKTRMPSWFCVVFIDHKENCASYLMLILVPGVHIAQNRWRYSLCSYTYSMSHDMIKTIQCQSRELACAQNPIKW